MSKKKILAYIVTCVSLGIAIQLTFYPKRLPDLSFSQGSPDTEEKSPEPLPREYTIGKFDERFGITRERFLQIVEEAKAIWENAAGKELFRFNATGPMKVNLVFDWREEALLKAREQRARLDENGKSFDMLKSEYERKFASVERERSVYDEQAQVYRTHLEEYNARVNRWNDGENRTESESLILQSHRKDLDRELALLEPKGALLKTNADELNALGQRITVLAKKFNLEVEVFNGTYVNQREFEKGLFDGKNIDIYEFDKEADLKVALVHELGHALGIEHVENPRSIMYRKLAAQDMNEIHLTSEDLAGLYSRLKH